MPTTQLVEGICSNDFDAQTIAALKAIEGIAARPDCTFLQLLDMARASVLQETHEAPRYWEASLWLEGGLIHMRFCSLSLQEQIDAARHVAMTYDHSDGYEGDASTTLMRFFCFWMKHPEGSRRDRLVEIIEDQLSLEDKQWDVFIDCFEFLARASQQ